MRDAGRWRGNDNASNRKMPNSRLATISSATPPRSLPRCCRARKDKGSRVTRIVRMTRVFRRQGVFEQFAEFVISLSIGRDAGAAAEQGLGARIEEYVLGHSSLANAASKATLEAAKS